MLRVLAQLISRKNQKKNLVWLKELKEEFDQVFDINRTSLSDSQTSQKRKSEELNEQVNHKFVKLCVFLTAPKVEMRYRSVNVIFTLM